MSQQAHKHYKSSPVQAAFIGGTMQKVVVKIPDKLLHALANAKHVVSLPVLACPRKAESVPFAMP